VAPHLLRHSGHSHVIALSSIGCSKANRTEITTATVPDLDINHPELAIHKFEVTRRVDIYPQESQDQYQGSSTEFMEETVSLTDKMDSQDSMIRFDSDYYSVWKWGMGGVSDCAENDIGCSVSTSTYLGSCMYIFLLQCSLLVHS
jgi:hypothetical protein